MLIDVLYRVGLEASLEQLTTLDSYLGKRRITLTFPGVGELVDKNLVLLLVSLCKLTV